MPRREPLLATGEIYHIFNRGLNHQPIFYGQENYQRAVDLFSFYRFAHLPLRFSHFNNLKYTQKAALSAALEAKDQKLISLISFCLMPNHFHFLLRQEKDGGISKFMANFQNSFTRYFNTRYQRTRYLFEGQFKAVKIETEEQLLHTSRYIHLNPYTAYVVKTTEALLDYPWSSLSQFIQENSFGICEVQEILNSFASKSQYEQFVLDQRDYQRSLDRMRHLLLENPGLWFFLFITLITPPRCKRSIKLSQKELADLVHRYF